jgi:hypothetical protein
MTPTGLPSPQPAAMPPQAGVAPILGQPAPSYPAPYPVAYPGTYAPMAGIQPVPTAVQPAPRQPQPVMTSGSERFVRGLLIGAAAAYLLTNEDVQRTVIKGAVKVWSTLQGGIEEAKERFRDAEAEIQAAVADKHP